MCNSKLKLSDRTVACGQCKECLKNNAADWAIRIMSEVKAAKAAFFITLTYNDQTVPWTDQNQTVQTLCYEDVRNYIRRCKRADQSEKNVQYVYVGEYGSKTWRPHYHLIWITDDYDMRDTLRQKWNDGLVDVQLANEAAVRYITNYFLLKNRDVLEGMEKPKMRTSHRMGASYISSNWHAHVGTTKSEHLSKKRELPRYYKEKLFTREEREIIRKRNEERFEEYRKKREENAKKQDPLHPPDYLKDQEAQKMADYLKRQNRNKI